MRPAPWRLAGLLVWLFGLAQPVGAQGDAGGGLVRGVPGGQEIELEDGRRLRLAGLFAPAAEGPDDVLGDSLARAAREALAGLVAGRRVRFALAAPKPDRYGRPVVWLSREGDGLDIQDSLLGAGHVLVFANLDAAARIGRLRAAERRARAAAAGLWAHERFGVRDAARADALPGRYSVLRGRVLSAEKVGGILYLNFGADWRRDFTIAMPWSGRRQLPAGLREAAAWPGRNVEVRGMTEWRNGPMITLGHPAQIELLGDESG